MEIENVKANDVENQRSLQEIMKNQVVDDIKNPILKRCAEKVVDPQKGVHQAFDRMHHRHNRT